MTPNLPRDTSAAERIHFADETGRCGLSEAAAVAAVAAALAHRDRAAVSITVVVLDDESLRTLNREHLGHDWTTDVVTFPFENPNGLEGEIYVSLDTAAAEAAAHGRSVDDELTLYIVHGTLHLCGDDDHDPAARAAMRQAERAVLATLGIAQDRFD